MRMLIAVAGRYTAESAEEMQKNLDLMNDACAEVYKKGHVPIVGVNNALPVTERTPDTQRRELIMDISLAVVDRCDAILMISHSSGADEEMNLFKSKDKPVYFSVNEIPIAKQ